MPKGQAEGVITKIIGQIIQECAAKGENVSETLSAYIIKAVVLNPDSEFLPDKPLAKEDVEKLIQICVERLTDDESPTLDTIKMQVYFETNHLERSEFLAEHHRVMQARLEPVVREALEARARTREEMEDVYRCIISAVLLRSGLGAPTNIEVVRETTAALQSIFPQTDVGSFLTANPAEKRSQLVEFTNIVTGIRLFNRDCSKGGAGIDDIPFLLTQGIPMTLNTLHDELQLARNLAATYTSLFLKIAAFDPSLGALSSANVTASSAEKVGITPSLLRSAVVNARQYESFLVTLEQELIQMTANVERLSNTFTARLKDLRDLIRDRPAVASMEVYPGFIQLANTWNHFQDEMVLLSVLTTTLNSLQSHFVGRRLKWTKDKLMHLINDSEIVFDDQIKQHGPMAEDERGNFTWVYPQTMDSASKLSPDLEGFCVWSLIKYQGLLVKADLSLGFVMTPTENRLYAFNSPEAARDFVVASDK
ncbi:hypothetical protein P879_08574 [Paragonimus westermani]|uniref:Cilia- and flagella-associated protein 206 n=1 Tax=Paragonimus westermani TaxID=34504 RepID=A0A8T0D3T6_9TREM|nr:hypothetical protein P879_08574 [Paragonimus westermani]